MDEDDFTATVAAAGCRVDGAGVDFTVVFGDTSVQTLVLPLVDLQSSP